MKKIALILGITGQDGSLLANYLLSKNYYVIGGARNLSQKSIWRLEHLKIHNKIKIYEFNIGNKKNIDLILKENLPCEIYFLAGEARTYNSFTNPKKVIFEAVSSLTVLLESCLNYAPLAKIFIASSSEIYGDFKGKASELTKHNPLNPYGIGKQNIVQLAKLYRDFHGLNLYVGIMFNHESFLRSSHFVTKKIIYNLCKLKLYGGNPISLGNIRITRDWTDARDMVKGIHAMLQTNQSDNYVLGSENLHSIKDFFIHAAQSLDFDPVFNKKGLDESCICKKTGQKLMTINPKYFRVNDLNNLYADSTKAKTDISWKPKISFSKMIEDMIDEELYCLKNNIVLGA